MNEKNQEETETSMTVDRLVSGDRPSLYFFGMVGAQAISKDQLAVFMVDALGRVCLMPPSAVQVLQRPKIHDDELDLLPENAAIQVLLKQGETEEYIENYLYTRSMRGIR